MSKEERLRAATFLGTLADTWTKAAACLTGEAKDAFLIRASYAAAGADALTASVHGLLMTEDELKEAILTGDGSNVFRPKPKPVDGQAEQA